MADVYVPKGTTDLSGLSISNNDTIIFAEGSQHVTAGLDLTSTASGLTIEAGPGFTGTLGGTDGSLQFKGATLTWKAGGGEIHFQPTSTQNVEIVGGARAYIKGGGTVGSLDIACPFARITDDVAVNTLKQRGGECTMGYNATKLQAVRMGSGSFSSERGLSGACYAFNGTQVWGRQQADLAKPAIDGSTMTVAAARISFLSLSTSTVGIEADDKSVLDARKVNNALTLSGNIGAASFGNSHLKSAFATVTTTNLDQYGGDADAGDAESGF
ncbi:MAG: hypothetical protein B7733_13130 [Myxococcales bacterium FL481]|nr:MAG: hypothetical protein B7733_13130 [Myxococcales bacterium FL481]